MNRFVIALCGFLYLGVSAVDCQGQVDVSWSTYHGGTETEDGSFCTVAQNGDVVIVGSTASTAEISSLGCFQETYGGGDFDGFVSRFDSGGNLLWSTYFGGAGIEFVWNAAINADGDIYVFGQTNSTSAIATTGTHQTVYGGGAYDAFIAKFNASGELQWSTYFGGSDAEGAGHGNNIGAIDGDGNVFLSGSTGSSNQISTTGAHQEIFGGFGDGFIAKFNPTGQLIWSTYVGANEGDAINGCTVDGNGNIIVTGRTASQIGIATSGSFDDSWNTGNWCAFLIKFNTNGERQWGTYYNADDGVAVCTDNQDNIYLTGLRAGVDSIATAGSHQEIRGNADDAYLVKFDNDGNRIWGTYYGGSGTDEGLGCAIDSENSVYLTGRTTSSNAIATANAFQTNFAGDFGDAFLVKFDSDGLRQWGTYFGGSGYEIGLSISVPSPDLIYLSGQTQSAVSISIGPSYQPNIGGGTDAFLTKFENPNLVGLTEREQPLIPLFYPNPASNFLTVETQESGLLELWSNDSKLIKSMQIVQSPAILDVTNLPSGIFHLRHNDKNIGSIIFDK